MSPTPLERAFVMHRKRLLLVASRFWPHGGDLEGVAAELACGFQEAGMQVTVLTGSWGASWPQSLVVRGIRMARVPHAPRGGWHTFRYFMAMRRWLRQHRDEYDLVYVTNLRHEAYAAMGAARGTGIPTLLRCEDWGTAGDAWWQTHHRLGPRVQRECHRAAGIVVPSSQVAGELVRYGYRAERIRVIPPGVAATEPRSADLRVRARNSLADANADLATADYAPVGLVLGGLDDTAGLTQVLIAWQEIAARWPTARLWLIGEGPGRDRLGARLNDLDLRYRVLLPGAFEEWYDLFHAADVLLWPAPCGGRQTILKAMAAGLPVVATDAPDLRAMMEHGQHGMLVATAEPGAWAAAISMLFESPSLAARMGAAAAKRVLARYPRHSMIDAHLDWFESLRSPREV